MYLWLKLVKELLNVSFLNGLCKRWILIRSFMRVLSFWYIFFFNGVQHFNISFMNMDETWLITSKFKHFCNVLISNCCTLLSWANCWLFVWFSGDAEISSCDCNSDSWLTGWFLIKCRWRLIFKLLAGGWSWRVSTPLWSSKWQSNNWNN